MGNVWRGHGCRCESDRAEQAHPIEWDSYEGRTPVEWLFEARPDNATRVTVTNYDFKGENVVEQALESTQGFTFMLSGLKAWLEHGITLELVADKNPDHHAAGWKGRGQ